MEQVLSGGCLRDYGIPKGGRINLEKGQDEDGDFADLDTGIKVKVNVF